MEIKIYEIENLGI